MNLHKKKLIIIGIVLAIVLVILKKEGFNVINFNTLEDFNNIDYNTDFYNKAHVNIYGSTKYTLYLSKYLNDNYNLESHKNNQLYKSWDEEYNRFKANFNSLVNKDFDTFLKQIEN